MELFEAVKEAVSARTAAEFYWIDVKSNGMARCIFHNDRNPSMKLDRRYHCFACQADGDVINLVAATVLNTFSTEREVEHTCEQISVFDIVSSACQTVFRDGRTHGNSIRTTFLTSL